MKKILLITLLLSLSNCITHKKITKTSDLSTPHGKPLYYQETSVAAIHLFGVYPIWGNAKIEAAIEEYARNAKKEKSTSIQLIQKETSYYYIVLPPLSFIFIPVTTAILGEVH